MLQLEKQITDGSAEVGYGQGERPKYGALRRAINGMYQDLLRPLERLENAVWMALPVPEVRKQADEETFRYLARHRRVIDAALDLFLTEMAGPDRTRRGFVAGGPEADTPDGVLQQRLLFAHAVGLRRASELLDRDITLPAGRQAPATQAMLDNAFTRMSTQGRMNIEDIRDELHSLLVSAQDAGLSPIETGRQIRNQFDQYKGWQAERLARTESAYAAEEGIRNQFEEFGVTHVRWVLSAGACPICQAFEGQLIPLEDVENLPPGHVNCLCSIVPA